MGMQSIKFGDFELDCESYQLRCRGRNQKLERLPMNLLVLLIRKHDRLVTREEIEEHLWNGKVFVDSNLGINTAIRKIRLALHDDSDSPRFVETITGRGYRFIATITEDLDTPVVPSPAVDEISPVFDEPPVAPPVTQVPPEIAEEALREPVKVLPHRPRSIMAILALVGVCSVVTMFWFMKPWSARLKVTQTVQLTSDGRFKGNNLVTDGSRLYFSERVADRSVVAAVPVTGGEPVIIPTPFHDTTVIALTNDKSQLLVGDGPLVEEKTLWLLPVLGGPPRRLADVVAHDASWSPDGKQLAYVFGSEVYLAKADGTQPHKMVSANPDPKAWSWWPRWSHDASRLRFTVADMTTLASAIWEVMADGRNLHPLLLSSDKSTMICGGEWTTDGRFYLFSAYNHLQTASPQPEANLWGNQEKAGGLLENGALDPFQITVGPMHFFTYALDPNRNVLYTISSQHLGELLRYDVHAKRVAPYLSGMSAQGLAFSPDGAWVAYVKFPHGELWRSRTNGEEALQLAVGPWVTAFPSWSPDASRIAFSAKSVDREWHLFVVPANGGPAQMLPGTTEGFAPTWSPDGTTLAFQTSAFGSRSKLRTIHLDNLQISDFPASEGLYLPQWSRDGRYVAAVSDGGSLVLFDFKTGKWSDWVTGRNLDSPRWSRDGKAIYVTDEEKGLRVLRVAVGDHTPAMVVDLNEIQFVRPYTPWFSLTPDDEPVLLRDTGGGFEIYAQTFELSR